MTPSRPTEAQHVSPRIMGRAVILWRRDTLVTRHQIRHLAKAPLIVRDADGKVRIVLFGFGQDPIAADDPSVDFLQPELPPKLHCLPGFVTDDNLGVGFEQTDDFLFRRHDLTLDAPPRCLSDCLINPRQKLLKLSLILWSGLTNAAYRLATSVP